MSFTEFISAIADNPAMLFVVLLTLGVILVNGWTDAPNAIATCVSTRSMRPKPAIMMAAVFNFLGVLVMSVVSKKVVTTIMNMANFNGGAIDSSDRTLALCAALFAIVVWATAAWAFGIPTSESHALIAGLTGAAVALQGSFSAAIVPSEWMKVVLGLVLSSVLGLAMGFIATKLIEAICRKMDRIKTVRFFKGAQITGGAAMAFMHGAQDGLKFIGVFMLGITMLQGGETTADFSIEPWLMVLCSAVMALGTSIGGYKIIKSVGMDMVKLETYQGFAADMGGALCLLIASVTGIPVSTTHTKTTAIMGVGAAKRLSAINWKIVKEMVLAWVLTFPGCGLLGYLMVKLFRLIF